MTHIACSICETIDHANLKNRHRAKLPFKPGEMKKEGNQPRNCPALDSSRNDLYGGNRDEHANGYITHPLLMTQHSNTSRNILL